MITFSANFNDKNFKIFVSIMRVNTFMRFTCLQKCKLFCIPQKRQNIYSENKNVSKRDMHANVSAKTGKNGPKQAKTGILSPENGKTFFLKIRNPDFGTSIIMCVPPKRAKHLF